MPWAPLRALDEFADEIRRRFHIPTEDRKLISATWVRACKGGSYSAHHEQALLDLGERILLAVDLRLEPFRQDVKKVLRAVESQLLNLLQLAEKNGAQFAKQAGVEFSALDRQTPGSLEPLLTRYRIDLENHCKRCEAALRDPEAALSPIVREALKGEPDSIIQKTYLANLREFSRYLKSASERFPASLPPEFLASWTILRDVVRLYEHAKVFGLRISPEGAQESVEPLERISISPRHAGSASERMNAAVTNLEQSGAFPAILPWPPSDMQLAHADAVVFCHRVFAVYRTGRLPQTLPILEIGVRGGQYAGDFLDQLLILDVERRAKGGKQPELYPRIRYHLADASEAALERAKEYPALRRHENAVRFHVLKAERLPVSPARWFSIRFHEFFSHQGHAGIMYADPKGKLYEFDVQAQLGKNAILRSADYGKAERRDLERAFHSPTPENLLPLHPESLQKISFGYRKRAYRPGAASALGELTRDLGDHLFPISWGKLPLFRQACKRLLVGGVVQVMDYGYKDFSGPRFQDYYFVSQLERRARGRVLNEISFPLYALEARRLRLRTSIRLQEEFLQGATGRPMIDPVLFVPGYAARKIIRHVSPREGIFRLQWLRNYPKVEAIALEHGTKARSPAQFSHFLEQLRRRADFGADFAIGYLPDAASDLENLALEMDVVINGIFSLLVEGEAFTYLPLDQPYLQEALHAVGYDVPALFAHLHRNPTYAGAWVLHARRER